MNTQRYLGKYLHLVHYIGPLHSLAGYHVVRDGPLTQPQIHVHEEIKQLGFNWQSELKS